MQSVTRDHTTQIPIFRINRLAGIPFLLGVGLFSGLEPQWLTLAVFVVCVAEVLADWRARPVPIDSGLGTPRIEERLDEEGQTSI
jgi:hypothetical protein